VSRQIAELLLRFYDVFDMRDAIKKSDSQIIE